MMMTQCINGVVKAHKVQTVKLALSLTSTNLDDMSYIGNKHSLKIIGPEKRRLVTLVLLTTHNFNHILID